jgi:hypothetical protein
MSLILLLVAVVAWYIFSASTLSSIHSNNEKNPSGYIEGPYLIGMLNHATVDVVRHGGSTSNTEIENVSRTRPNVTCAFISLVSFNAVEFVSILNKIR